LLPKQDNPDQHTQHIPQGAAQSQLEKGLEKQCQPQLQKCLERIAYLTGGPGHQQENHESEEPDQLEVPKGHGQKTGKQQDRQSILQSR
jgi:hypothetical protein